MPGSCLLTLGLLGGLLGAPAASAGADEGTEWVEAGEAPREAGSEPAPQEVEIPEPPGELEVPPPEEPEEPEEPDEPAADESAPDGPAPEPETPPEEPELVEPPSLEPEPGPEPEQEPAGDEDWFGDEADDEPFPETDEVEADVDGPAGDYDPLRDSPQALAARHWVRTGIITMSTGGALLVGAILMAASDPCNLKVGNSCQPEARNRAAVVMVVPAAVLIGGGATALGIGMARRHRLALELHAGRWGGGLVLRGRF